MVIWRLQVIWLKTLSAEWYYSLSLKQLHITLGLGGTENTQHKQSKRDAQHIGGRSGAECGQWRCFLDRPREPSFLPMAYSAVVVVLGIHAAYIIVHSDIHRSCLSTAIT